MAVDLTVCEGPDRGERLTLSGSGVALIGRGDGCALRLLDRKVSRRHCEVLLDPRGARLRDVPGGGSTSVNGVRIGEAALEDGDRVRLGDTTIACAVGPEIEADGGPAVGLAGHRILEPIGRGAHGRVYRAIDLASGAVVAVKVLSLTRDADPRAIARFVRGARVEASLRHPAIVQVLHVVRPGDLHFVMEFVDGEDLRRAVERRGPLPAPEAARITAAAADGLQFACERAVVHRDVKPENLLLARDGAVRITDFGLARSIVEAGVTTTGEVLGTPAFVAPEQIERARDVDQRADVYALGATLYFLLTGEPPFAGDLGSVLSRVRREPAPSLLGRAGVPEGLARAVGRSLEKDPTARFQTPGAFADALRPFAASPSA